MHHTSPPPLPLPSLLKIPSIHHASLLSLCTWWEDTHDKEDPLPHICYQYTSPDKLHTRFIAPPMEYNFARVASEMLLDKGNGDDEADQDVDVEHAVHNVGRSLGLVGIGLGVLFMLLIIVFITCLRRRKAVQSIEDEFHRSTQVVLSVSINGLRNSDSPPAYNLVVRNNQVQEEVQVEEEEPPPYATVLGQDTYRKRVNLNVKEELPPVSLETYEINKQHESEKRLGTCILPQP